MHRTPPGLCNSVFLLYKCSCLHVSEFLYLSVDLPITLTCPFASFNFKFLTPLPLYASFLSLCDGPPLHSMPCSFTCLAVFRCRWFITQPCFSRACAQKQCVRGWAWYCYLICRSKAKGWVIPACMPPSD